MIYCLYQMAVAENKVDLHYKRRARRVLRKTVLGKKLPFDVSPDKVLDRIVTKRPELENVEYGPSPLQKLRDELEIAKKQGRIH